VISPTQRPLPDKTQHPQETETMPPAVFESTIPASERPQTHPLDRAVTGIGRSGKYLIRVSDTKTDIEVYDVWLWELQWREFVLFQ